MRPVNVADRDFLLSLISQFLSSPHNCVTGAKRLATDETLIEHGFKI